MDLSCAQQNITILPLLSCPFVELQDSRVDCSPSQPHICVACPILGKFVAGGELDDHSSPGHLITMLAWIFTVIIGIFGIFSNSLIIIIMKRQNSSRAFDLLLIALAVFDLGGSVTAVIAASATEIIFEKLSHGMVALYFIYFSTIICFFARSGSSFMTVLIAVERYLVISFPTASINWFTTRNTKMLIGVVFLIATSIALTRFTSFAIVPNNLPRDIGSIATFDYLILATCLEEFWYGTFKGLFTVIDFWVPLPLLLFFNILLYIEIRKFARRREQLSVRQRKDIRAMKMFIPVVIVLFICNIEPYLYLYYIKIELIIAREHLMGVCLSVAVNSAVNLPIYYFKGGSFRNEVRDLLSLTRQRQDSESFPNSFRVRYKVRTLANLTGFSSGMEISSPSASMEPRSPRLKTFLGEEEAGGGGTNFSSST